MDPRITQETLDLIKQMTAQDIASLRPELAKAYNTSLGLVWYDLEPAAKLLYPVLTPLRNMIPRLPGDGGTATNWKQITAINANNVLAGVGEGNRSGRISITANNKTASYKGMGLEDLVTFEADMAAKNFDDVKALAVMTLLQSLMIEEEKTDLFGCGTYQLNAGNAAPKPTATAGNTVSGNITANTVYHCRYVPLTPRGLSMASLSGGVVCTQTRSNPDSTNDTYGVGTGVGSTANNANSGGSSCIRFAVPAANVTAGTLKGAAGYAWYVGDANVGANLKLTAITTVPFYDFEGTGAAAANQSWNDIDAANDHSNCSLIYDGLWPQICAANSGAYFKDLAGNNLTGTNGAAEIVEIETALKSFWDNYKLGPDLLLVAANQMNTITTKIMSGNGLPVYRFNADAGGGPSVITAGAIVGQYVNRYTNALMKIMLHPNMPSGSMMFYSSRIPYAISNVPNLLVKRLRREYYQIEWPLRTRSWEYGVYFDGLLQCYFPPAFGLITGINA